MTTANEIVQVVQGVKVKNAVLININKEKYILSHYDTQILEVINKEVIFCTAKTASSIRAVNQALKFLGSNKTCKQIKAELNSNNGSVLI